MNTAKLRELILKEYLTLPDDHYYGFAVEVVAEKLGHDPGEVKKQIKKLHESGFLQDTTLRVGRSVVYRATAKARQLYPKP